MTTASDCCGVVSESAAASDGVWAGCDNRFRNGGGIDLGCSFSENAFFENAFFENAFFDNAFFENAFFENAFFENLYKFLAGSFSAVSKRKFARKYAFDSIFQDLQDLHTFAPLQSQNFSKKSV